jgi:hypothetical protein
VAKTGRTAPLRLFDELRRRKGKSWAWCCKEAHWNPFGGPERMSKRAWEWIMGRLAEEPDL